VTDWFVVEEIEDGTWCIQEPHHMEEVCSYLVVSNEHALLIDTGLGISNIKDVVERITKNHVKIVNTHSHYDHVGDNHRFKEISIHKNEARHLERGHNSDMLLKMVEPEMFKKLPPDGFRPEAYTIKPSRANRQLKDGEVLSIGHRTLKVLHTPGHSPGSICLWEEDRGFLFSGDTLYDGPIYAHLPHSNFDDYLQSLSMLCSHVPKINKVFPSHGPTPLEPMIILKIAQAFQQVSQGGVEYWLEESPWGRARFYQLDGISLYIK
jgi:glyoxylase-like metal-dependent hydrolase (beta-lactamase superfamily II)